MSRLRSSPLLLIFGFVLVFVLIWSILDDARSRALGWENVPAGELELRSPDGRQIRLTEFRGKVVLIDFWGTWCGPCRESIPGIQKLYAKYRDQGFQVIGPALENDDGRQVPGSVQAMKMEYPVGFPVKREQVESFVGGGIPFMVLVDKKGIKRWRKEGYIPGSEEELERRIQALLAE